MEGSCYIDASTAFITAGGANCSRGQNTGGGGEAKPTCIDNKRKYNPSMHNFNAAAVNGSYMFRLDKATIIRLVYMRSIEGNHKAAETCSFHLQLLHQICALTGYIFFYYVF
jgi:hypothetical protein